MTLDDRNSDTPQGFGLDVVCEPQEDLPFYMAELEALGDEDPRRAALIFYELGRIHLSEDNIPAAAEALLKSYTLRPQFRPTLHLARQLYRHRADYKLVVKLLEAESRATRDPLTRATLLRQQARLVWSRLGDLSAALQILETAHRYDPTDLATLKLLELFYSLEANQEAQLSVLDRQLTTVSDQGLRAALLVQKALLLQEQDPATAIELLTEAQRETPGDLSLLCYLEQIYAAQERHAELAETLIEQSQQRDASPLWTSTLLARAARIFRDQISDTERAYQVFRQSLDVHAVLGVAADCFELLLKEHRYPDAAEVGDTLFKLCEDADSRAAVACQIGDLFRFKLQDKAKAALWYALCLQAAPAYQPALEGLGWILEERGDVDRLIKLHRADLDQTKEPRAIAQKLYRIAALYERHGEDDSALGIHREALTALPGFKPSVSSLERLFYRLGRWTELLQLYDDELTRDHDPERVIYILETMAAVWYHQLRHADNALDRYRSVLAISPDNQPVISTMARLFAETRRWHDLVEMNEREIALTSDSSHRVDLLQRTGEVWEDHNLNLDQAIDCYRRALELDPAHLPALKALGRIYRQKGRWNDLIQMHQAEIRATSDPDKIIELLYDIAETFEEELLDELSAATTYRAIIERSPDQQPAIAALAMILERRAEWRQLAELQDSYLNSLSDDRTKALLLWRVGLLREERLSSFQGAIKDYTRALRLAPDLAPAYASLTHLLEIAGKHNQLADLYSASLEQSRQPEESAAIALRLAEHYERVQGDTRMAALFFERAVEQVPSVWCLWSLVQSYERLGMPRELCGTLERLANTIQDDQEVKRIRLRIGHLLQVHQIGDPLPHLSAAMDLPLGRIHAQRAMEHLLGGRARQGDQADLILSRIERTKEPLELACLWTAMAEAYLRREELTAAEQAYRTALNHSKSHLSALWGLERLLERGERWSERAELAEQEANAMESTLGLGDTLLQAGILWEDKAKDVKRAIPLYRRALKVLPAQAEAYKRLHAILSLDNNWSELASIIRSQISGTIDGETSLELFTELAKIYLDKLDHTRKGMTCLHKVLDTDPINLYALTRLGDLYFKAQDWRPAQEMFARAVECESEPAVLQHLYRRLGDTFKILGQPAEALRSYRQASAGDSGQDPVLLRLIVEAAESANDAREQVAALSRLAECSNSQEEKVLVRKRIARIAEDLLEDDSLAVQTLEEALVLDPLDIEAIEQLSAIFGRASNRNAVVQHLHAAVEHHRAALANHPFDSKLYRQLGRIFQWQRQLDRLYCTCLAQSHIDTLDEVELRFFQEHHKRCAPIATTPLSRSRYESLVLPAPLLGAFMDILPAGGKNLQKRAAVDPVTFGLDRSSRVKPNTPIYRHCQDLAALVGVVEFDLWQSSSMPDLITAEMLSKPSLILGSRVASNTITAAERFRIGRALFYISENALVLRDLQVPEMRALFSALGRVAQPSWDLELSPDDAILEAEVRTLQKLLSRKERKVIGSVLSSLGETIATFDISQLSRALKRGALRAGLLVAGDPKVALQEASTLEDISPRGLEMADLLQYLVSEEYFTLRQELGLAPGSQ